MIGRRLVVSINDSFADDLTSILYKLKATLDSTLGQAPLTAAIALRAHDGAAYPRAYFNQRMAQLAPMFDAAVERGELLPGVDREELFSLAAGAIYFRTFIGGRSVDDDLIRTIVANTCWLCCSPSAAAKLSLPARIA